MSEKFDEINDILDDPEFRFSTLEKYNATLALAQDEEDKDLFRMLKLTELLKFGGSYGFYGSKSAEEMLKVLKIMGKSRELECTPLHMDKMADYLKIPFEYMHLIYCVLDQARIIEYGTTIRVCWLTERGEEVLNPAYTPEFRKMLDPNNEWREYQIL